MCTKSIIRLPVRWVCSMLGVFKLGVLRLLSESILFAASSYDVASASPSISILSYSLHSLEFISVASSLPSRVSLHVVAVMALKRATSCVACCVVWLVGWQKKSFFGSRQLGTGNKLVTDFRFPLPFFRSTTNPFPEKKKKKKAYCYHNTPKR